MTQISPTCTHGTARNAGSPRRAALNPGRRHGVQLAYDGVTAAYIREIARRPGSVRSQPHPLASALRPLSVIDVDLPHIGRAEIVDGHGVGAAGRIDVDNLDVVDARGW
jgi:hypothetical protein